MNSTPYSKLARIYDKVMTHVNYPAWADYITHLLRYSKININNIIDISCGTGKHLSNIKLNGANFIGSDISHEMLQIARANLDYKSVHLIAQDSCNLGLKENCVEGVLMLYDSINYLFTDQQVLGMFDEVIRILKNEGIFIFDFVTQEGLKDNYVDYWESDSWEGLAYERHCWYSFEERIQYNEFLFLYNGKSYREVHMQKIRTIDEWHELISKSNMELSYEFSNFSKATAKEKSERVHFVCHSLKM